MKFIYLFCKIVFFSMSLQVLILNHIKDDCFVFFPFLTVCLCYPTQKEILNWLCSVRLWSEGKVVSSQGVKSPASLFRGDNSWPGLLTAVDPHDGLQWRLYI